MRKYLVLLAIGAVMSSAVGNGLAGGAAVAPLHFHVTGYCSSLDGGVLHSQGSGFTPNQPYTTQAFYPSGRPYPSALLKNPGYASASGTTPNWSWDCSAGAHGLSDRPGIYGLIITQGKRSVREWFIIHLAGKKK